MYFFVADLSGNTVVGKDAEHLWAMRPEQGEEIWVTNLAGELVRAKVSSVQKKQRGVVWSRLRTEKRENPAKNILIQAKTDRAYLEKLIEILPHMQVSDLYIIDTELSEKKQPVNRERLVRILIRACEQAQVVYLTRIHIVTGIAESQALIQKLQPTVLALPKPETIVIGASHKKDQVTLMAKNTPVLVGPEGGWTEAEEAWFGEQGLPKYSLGTVVFPAWLAGFTYFARL
jgi:RsmE family RNA methyltransferase